MHSADRHNDILFNIFIASKTKQVSLSWKMWFLTWCKYDCGRSTQKFSSYRNVGLLSGYSKELRNHFKSISCYTLNMKKSIIIVNSFLKNLHFPSTKMGEDEIKALLSKVITRICATCWPCFSFCPWRSWVFVLGTWCYFSVVFAF